MLMLHHAERLKDVDPRLAQLAVHVGSQRDLIVIEGARSLEAEQQAIAGGFSSLTNPMDSKHVIDPPTRPLALAIDLAPWPLDWKDLGEFDNLAVAMKLAAAELDIPVVWGGDWHTFKDRPHWELED